MTVFKQENAHLEIENALIRAREQEVELGYTNVPRDSQDLIKVTIEQMHEGIQIIDRSWRYVYLNDAASKHGHLEKSKLLGRTMMECFPGIENTDMFDVLKSVVKHNKPRDMENLFEYPNGEKCWFEIFFEPHVLGVLIRSIDITARKKLEEQYLHSQKMQSIGLLAGGIAHDFNNKLGIMTLYSEMLLAENIGDSTYLNNILNAIEDSSKIVKQLLAFGRKQILDLKVTNLNDIIEQIKNPLSRLLGAQIQLKFILDNELHNIKVDPVQIDQVILNLCINAKDAMSDGGVLTIETTNVNFDEAYCSRHPNIVPGNYVMLAVSDTGIGISNEIRNRIFEPFFTTKPGKGTGLGLPSVHGIVYQSRGHIDFHTKIGEGTIFKLYFPEVKDAKPAKTKVIADPTELVGTETILLVEDDTILQEALAKTLENAGYNIYVASNSSEAKTHFLAQRGQFHLLLTDVVFEKSSGLKLSKELQSINPLLKTIFISGYTEDTLAQQGILEDDIVLVQKPVSTNRLLRAIRQVLDDKIKRGVI
jgi:two-component system, cell cycle sensor histidine kinase and response regulator CckA